MQKSGIKSFIFSFVFSLCAVFAVDKAILHTQKPAEPTKKITYKNIALFSQEKGAIVASATMTKSPEHIVEKSQTESAEGAGAENSVQSAENIESSVVETPSETTDSIVLADASVVYNPNAEQKQIDEPSFEEVMKLVKKNSDIDTQIAENGVQISEPVFEDNIDNIVQKSGRTDNIVISDTSLDENLNLWIPLEKSTQKSMDVASAESRNQIAMSTGDVMISSLVEKTLEDKNTVFDNQKKDNVVSGEIVVHTDQEVKVPTEKNSSPWVIAKGTKFPKNHKVITDKTYNNLPEKEKNDDIKVVADTLSSGKELNQKPNDTVDVAYKVMQNILIPVPEEILKDDNLTPTLVSTDESKEKEKIEIVPPEEEKPAETKKKKSKGFFKSLGALFGSDKNKKDSENFEEYDVFVTDETKGEETTSGKLTKKGEKPHYSGSDEIPEILPTEIRLSFQPERAEISGSTLKWLKAFADNANKNKDIYIEIRIDGSNSFALQQKRLNLLQGVFFENGVSPQKIETIFTSREPNSFVIRSLKIKTMTERKEKKKEQPTYYQSW